MNHGEFLRSGIVSLEIYVCEKADGTELGPRFADIGEARAFALAHHLRLVAEVYEFAGSELVEDHTREEGGRG